MEIHTIGGFNEVGKNMTAVKVGDDVILFDAGFHLPAIIELQEEDEIPTEKTELVGAVSFQIVASSNAAPFSFNFMQSVSASEAIPL